MGSAIAEHALQTTPTCAAAAADGSDTYRTGRARLGGHTLECYVCGNFDIIDPSLTHPSNFDAVLHNHFSAFLGRRTLIAMPPIPRRRWFFSVCVVAWHTDLCGVHP